jgi:hypothetical protein
MAKLATIEFDASGRATVTHTDLPPAQEPAMTSSSNPPPSPAKRIPSSPYKPYTSDNFFDLTASVSPEGTPKSSGSDVTEISESNLLSRALRESDRENVVPGSLTKIHGTDHQSKPQKGLSEIGTSQGIRKGNLLSCLSYI